MNKITIAEAKRYLMNASPGMYSLIVLDFLFEGISENSSAYESHGAIVLKRWWKESDYFWYICDLGTSDMISAIKETREEFKYDKAEIYFIDGIPKAYNPAGKTVRLIYTCTGKTSAADSKIRLLTDDDSEQIVALTNVTDDDNEYAKAVSGYIRTDFDCSKQDSDIHLLGIFDGTTLSGAVSLVNVWNKGAIFTKNILVSKNYRGRGYASRLIRAATAMYPDIIYMYECEKNNAASSALAKSVGYTLAGVLVRG